MIASSAFVDAANCTAERIHKEDGTVGIATHWRAGVRTSIPLLDLRYQRWLRPVDGINTPRSTPVRGVRHRRIPRTHRAAARQQDARRGWYALHGAPFAADRLGEQSAHAGASHRAVSLFVRLIRVSGQPTNAGIESQPRTVDVRDRRHAPTSMSHFGNRLSTSSSAIRPSSRARGAPTQK